MKVTIVERREPDRLVLDMSVDEADRIKRELDELPSEIMRRLFSSWNLGESSNPVPNPTFAPGLYNFVADAEGGEEEVNMWGHVAGWLMLVYVFTGMVAWVEGLRVYGLRKYGLAGGWVGAALGIVLAVAIMAGAFSISTPVK